MMVAKPLRIWVNHEESSRVTDKIAVLTGASRGLGRNIAVHLARQGVSVIGTYHSREDEAAAAAAEITAAGAQAAMLPFDASRTETFAGFAASVADVLRDDFGRPDFDFLINNAGIGINAPFAQTTEAQFDELVQVQLKAPFFLTQRLLPLIADGGRILNVSSGLARFTLPGFAAYAATKGAIEVLTRYQAKELGPRRIRVNVVAPGAIETDFGGGHVRRRQPRDRRHHPARPGGPARRRRRRRGRAAVGRLRLGQRHPHRGVGRPEHLGCPARSAGPRGRGPGGRRGAGGHGS
jgi:NAD(P)-dependent dehydrogenase (short-subunit alcohol dehydrogenase family)